MGSDGTSWEVEPQIVETLDGVDMPQLLEANIQKINDLLMGLSE